MGIAYNSRIVTDGLVLALDAGNIKSYDANENLITYSNDFTTWTKQAISGGVVGIIPNNLTSPDGAINATRYYVQTAGSSFYSLFTGVSVSVSTSYTYSVFIKPGESTTTGLVIFDGVGNASSSFNLNTGALIATSSNANTTIQSAGSVNYGNGWYRYYITFSSTLSGGFTFKIDLGTTTLNQGFYIYGAQVEKGSVVNPYYPTTGTTKTRGTTWTDLSGRGNTGTLTNGPTYSSANGGVLSFDGSNNYVSSFPTQISGTGSKTVSCWFKTNITTRNGLCGIRQSDTLYGWVLTVNRTSTGNLTYFHAGGNELQVAAGITTNTWYNACVTYDLSTATVTLYLNGSQIGSPTPSFSTILSSNYNGVIGAEDGAFGNKFNGNISNTLIYNRALTASEIQQNFNALRGRYAI
jgi:hypothetical protein